MPTDNTKRAPRLDPDVPSLSLSVDAFFDSAQRLKTQTVAEALQPTPIILHPRQMAKLLAACKADHPPPNPGPHPTQHVLCRLTGAQSLLLTLADMGANHAPR